ncbi:MAG: cupin domain-containing protein [Planctomycetota bacterium]|nr:cupin domain-containing protein [Planctomycetota bacterium]
MPAAQDATVYRLEDLEQDYPREGIERRRIEGDRFMLLDIRLKKGAVVPMHAHENEQMTTVISGLLRFTIGQGDEVRVETLGPGQVLHLPSNFIHGAQVLEDTVVYDVFSPVSETIGVDQIDD